jgi:hypothetical protein
MDLPRDTGLMSGPQPGLLQTSLETVAELVTSNERLRILVRDNYKPIIQKTLGDSKTACFGIIEAKGLEFPDVLLVDFFSSMSEKMLHKAYKNLLLGDPQKGVSIHDIPSMMELELKLLYTAITRSCNRLFFIETKESQGYSAWSRCLLGKQLANTIAPESILRAGGVMTTDDWLVEGLDTATLIEENNKEDGVSLLQHAITSFERAGNKDLEAKARCHLKALELEMAAIELSQGEEIDGLLVETRASKSTLAYLEAGLISEAARVCKDFCTGPSLSSLPIRLKRLAETVHK